MRIIIVGAGLGGLTAALCFARKGHEVQVLEQRPDPSPLGGGINIRPGATRFLQSWGLTEELEEICDVTTANALRSLKTGQVATRTIATDISNAPDLGTNRDILISVLHRKALEVGATLLFGTTVTQVTEDSHGARVKLGNGTILEADLVLAADGVRSAIRRQILQGSSGPIEPEVSDWTLYGVLLSKEQMNSDPELKRLMDNSYINVYMGENGLVSVTSRYNQKLGTFQALFCIKGHTGQQGLWDEQGDIKYVRKMFQGSCNELLRVLEISETCDRWRLSELPDLPRWASENGRVLLLGDSAVSQLALLHIALQLD
ncbi:hypothetical protein diail_11227 [Diaporthe ilicicola]|nr:hypothetical protein diail_11227 [Diaporthe ilicicola]